MKIGRRSMTKLLAGAVPAAWMGRASAWQKPRAIAPGAFQPTWDSLKQYQAPDWFRDGLSRTGSCSPSDPVRPVYADQYGYEE
jgi:hypothetical protein